MHDVAVRHTNCSDSKTADEYLMECTCTLHNNKQTSDWNFTSYKNI